MGVTGDRAVELDRVLELADAAQESVVELMLLKQVLRPAVEYPLGPGEFFGERGDDGLRLADGLRFELFDPVGEAVN